MYLFYITANGSVAFKCYQPGIAWYGFPIDYSSVSSYAVPAGSRLLSVAILTDLDFGSYYQNDWRDNLLTGMSLCMLFESNDNSIELLYGVEMISNTESGNNLTLKMYNITDRLQSAREVCPLTSPVGITNMASTSSGGMLANGQAEFWLFNKDGAGLSSVGSPISDNTTLENCKSCLFRAGFQIFDNTTTPENCKSCHS